MGIQLTVISIKIKRNAMIHCKEKNPESNPEELQTVKIHSDNTSEKILTGVKPQSASALLHP